MKIIYTLGKEYTKTDGTTANYYNYAIMCDNGLLIHIKPIFNGDREKLKVIAEKYE